MAATSEAPHGHDLKASLCVHSYNEGPALERLILSSLHAAHNISEWVILDHRSGDDTQARLDRLEPLLTAYGIPLVRLHESRDLSKHFTFAELRDNTIQACRSDVVALMDADFVLSQGFNTTLANSLVAFQSNQRLAAIRFRIPIIWDAVRTNATGVITSHGRVFMHGMSHRILRRTAVRYTQTGNDGRWEKANYKGMHRIDTTNDDGRILVSLNIKPRERLELRATMTEFMHAAMRGKLNGSWLDQATNVPKQPEYTFKNIRLTPDLNLANLEL